MIVSPQLITLLIGYFGLVILKHKNVLQIHLTRSSVQKVSFESLSWICEIAVVLIGTYKSFLCCVFSCFLLPVHQRCNSATCLLQPLSKKYFYGSSLFNSCPRYLNQYFRSKRSCQYTWANFVNMTKSVSYIMSALHVKLQEWCCFINNNAFTVKIDLPDFFGNRNFPETSSRVSINNITLIPWPKIYHS